jgi:hypothetical protein
MVIKVRKNEVLAFRNEQPTSRINNLRFNIFNIKCKSRGEMEELVEKIGELMVLQEKSARIIEAKYTGEVETIIKGSSTNRQRIEKALDVLLDFAFDANVLEIFRKLCKYYYYIDPQSTCFYIQSYRELWDNKEDEKNEK